MSAEQRVAEARAVARQQRELRALVVGALLGCLMRARQHGLLFTPELIDPEQLHVRGDESGVLLRITVEIVDES